MTTVTVTASDLNELSRRVGRIRRSQPDAAVQVPIYVAIADEASTARSELAATKVAPPLDALIYVGTPVGLLGLIQDIDALGLADGASIRPLLPDPVPLLDDVVATLHARLPAFVVDLKAPESHPRWPT